MNPVNPKFYLRQNKKYKDILCEVINSAINAEWNGIQAEILENDIQAAFSEKISDKNASTLFDAVLQDTLIAFKQVGWEINVSELESMPPKILYTFFPSVSVISGTFDYREQN